MLLEGNRLYREVNERRFKMKENINKEADTAVTQDGKWYQSRLKNYFGKLGNSEDLLTKNCETQLENFLSELSELKPFEGETIEEIRKAS